MDIIICQSVYYLSASLRLRRPSSVAISGLYYHHPLYLWGVVSYSSMALVPVSLFQGAFYIHHRGIILPPRLLHQARRIKMFSSTTSIILCEFYSVYVSVLFGYHFFFFFFFLHPYVYIVHATLRLRKTIIIARVFGYYYVSEWVLSFSIPPPTCIIVSYHFGPVSSSFLVSPGWGIIFLPGFGASIIVLRRCLHTPSGYHLISKVATSSEED